MRICARLLSGLGCVLLATTAGAASLKLENGDTLNGEIVEERDDAIAIRHPVLGLLEVPRERLFVEPPPRPGLFGTGFLEGWSRALNFGVSGANGNTVNFNLAGGIDLKAESRTRRWAWTGRYILKSEDESLTDHNARLESRYDWILAETRWFLFLHPAYDFDRFKHWRHRITLSGGPGYDIVKSERWDLRTSVGLSGQREFQGQETNRLSALWALNTELRLAENHSIAASNQVFPALVNEPGEYRNLSTLGWRVRLSESPGLNLLLGVENEYESDAPPEDEKNDLKYFATLGVDF